MRRRQRQIIAMFTIVTMLLPLLAGCGSEVSKLPGESTMETTASPELTTAEPTAGNFEPTTEEMPAESQEETTAESYVPVITELSLNEVKREVLTLYPGSGDGQVGYSDESRGTQPIGPEAFAVEGGVAYVLDAVNDRVIIGKDGAYSYIDVSDYDRVKYMEYGNGRIAVAGYLNIFVNTQVIVVYSPDGKKEAQIELDDVGFVNKIVSIDDSSVEVELNGDEQYPTRYRYDWTTKKLENLGEAPGVVSIDVGDQTATVLGYGEGVTYYRYRDHPRDVIGRELQNVGRWYTVQELLGYRTLPLDSLYVSEDGKLYLMECFEDRTVISELVLGEE